MNRLSARPLRTDLRHALAAAVALVALGAVPQANAFDFQSDNGLSGSWDTSVSFTEAWRVKSQDASLIGIPEGGTARNVNADNGDLNYRVGEPFTQAIKLVTELSLKYGNYGLFARGSGLYDYQVMDQNTDRTPISHDAKELTGRYTRLLDAFVFGKWQLGEGHPVEVRAGNQVINWGESLFLQSGLTGVNAIDVAALRQPGSELKEAFWAQPMVHATLGVSEHISADAFYMLDWRRTQLEPEGTYFSTNDFVTPGGYQQFIGFGAYSDQGVDFRPLGGPFIGNFWATPRAPDVTPKHSGQGGLALRFHLPDLGSGTEISLYAMQYASRTPVVSTRSGTQAGIGNAVGAATAVGAVAKGLAAGLPEATAIAAATGAGLQAAAAAGGNISAQTLASYATIGASTYLAGGDINGQAAALANHEYIETNQFFAEYPDKLQTFAVSFNTQLGRTGVTLAGELDYRHNTPLQYDGSELVFAAGTALESVLVPLQGLALPGVCTPAFPTLTDCGQLAQNKVPYGPSAYIQGWGRFDVWQLELNATKNLPPMLGARQVVLLVEAGVTDVPGLPNKTSGGPNGNGLLLAGSGNNLPGNVAVASAQGASGGATEPLDRFADQYSWGYVALLAFEYPSAIGPWNINPKLVWQQDIKGTSPLGGNFVEGRHTLGLTLNANLENRWDLDLSYTSYGGGGQYNQLRDRDFVAATVKYSF
jgi:Protein of unknown function (DUF1302)